MTRPPRRFSGSPAFLLMVAMATSVFLVNSLPGQPSQAGSERPVETAVPPASESGPVQVTSGDGPGAIDREAILEAARQLLGRDVAVEEVRLGELLDRLKSSPEQAARLPHRWVILAIARSMTGYRGRVEDMSLGEFLSRLRPIQVRTGDERVSNGAGLVDLARRLFGSINRVDNAADPLREERSRLQLQHAAAAMALVQVRRDGFGQGDLDAVYEEARRRLLDSGQGDAAGLLDGLRWIEEEVATADPKPENHAAEIALLQEARLHAFGPEMADLLFSREDAMERYELDRVQIEDDPTLTDEDRGARLRARREELRVELAAEGTFVGFVDSDSGVSPPLASEEIPDATAPSPAAPAVLATTQCDTDPGAVFFTPTVNPSLLNAFLENTPNIAVGSLNPVAFGGVCVTHHLVVALSAGVATQNSSFAVTPGDGSLQVLLNLGAMGGSLRGQSYYTTGCATLCPGFLCDLEKSLLGGVINGTNGSVSASSVRVTQVADTCVLSDCTAVHPLVGTTAQVSGFRMTLFAPCGGCFDPCIWPLPACPICVDPCSGLNSAITALLDWLVNIEGLIAGTFVQQDGSGTLINVFSSGIVNDGCLPIDEVIECRRAGAPETAVAGLVRPPRGGLGRALLWAAPVLMAIGAIVRLRWRGANSRRHDRSALIPSRIPR